MATFLRNGTYSNHRFKVFQTRKGQVYIKIMSPSIRKKGNRKILFDIGNKKPEDVVASFLDSINNGELEL